MIKEKLGEETEKIRKNSLKKLEKFNSLPNISSKNKKKSEGRGRNENRREKKWKIDQIP